MKKSPANFIICIWLNLDREKLHFSQNLIATESGMMMGAKSWWQHLAAEMWKVLPPLLAWIGVGVSEIIPGEM